MREANLRNLAFLSDLGDPRSGVKALRKVCKPVANKGDTYPGLNFFAAQDQTISAGA